VPLPDQDTLALAVLVATGAVCGVLVLARLADRRPSDPHLVRRRHAVAARQARTVVWVAAGLLVLALLLGRVLLGALALVLLAVFGTVAVARGRRSR
jgi:4-hydroxybenzoate polyprenyltransferase